MLMAIRRASSAGSTLACRVSFIPAPPNRASLHPAVKLRAHEERRGWRFTLTGGRAISHTMSDAAKTGTAQVEWMRRLAAARGLGRPFVMHPETVTAAFARASQCMSTLPADMSPVTEPALRFDPRAFKGHRGVPVDPGPAHEWLSPLL
jgi:hypothetical protein